MIVTKILIFIWIVAWVGALVSVVRGRIGDYIFFLVLAVLAALSFSMYEWFGVTGIVMSYLPLLLFKPIRVYIGHKMALVLLAISRSSLSIARLTLRTALKLL